ncbi:hypothetical protein F2P56_011784 [Juglans regia]|uniref:Uncharacterized protein LOC109019106 n=2 Tax=Juglans regia TaxID=51240 RepID=A0A2I4HL27_JUGRE|nr:uncharacterized protein LOC109019106 [Juglans regia]KAF5471342.1 hypothetical protein F2P56_011784 [Juglans regia]
MAERRLHWDDPSSQILGSHPCVFVGDFNIIRNDSKRRRGRPQPSMAMEDFNNWIHQRGLMEMSTTGSMFTWCNGQSGLACSWARLDHALMDSSSIALFHNATYSYFPRSTSDHTPMFIALKKDPFVYGLAPFRFQQMWVDHHSFLDCVRVKEIEQQLLVNWEEILERELHMDPQAIINKIHRLMSFFFWGEIEGWEKKKRMAWKHFYKPVEEGGHRLRHLHDMQKVLHMRFTWNLIQDLESKIMEFGLGVLAPLLRPDGFSHDLFLVITVFFRHK